MKIATKGQETELLAAIVRQFPYGKVPADRAQHLIERQDELGAVLAEALAGTKETQYFTPVLDADVPERHKATLAKYRKLAAEHGVPATVPVCYRVKAGFTLKTHAPEAGPCLKQFCFLQRWSFPDEATSDCLVFWVPRILNGSTGKNKYQQTGLLRETRVRLGLLDHHMNGFGDVGLVAGLILAHFRATGERIPLDCCWVRTDTLRADCDYLVLGRFDEDGLSCSDWSYSGGSWNRLGVFALGVDVLGF